MAYYSESELKKIGFKYLGQNVKLSDRAILYEPELMSIGDHSRIDDLCILSGNIQIGKYCHITPMCLIAGGKLGVELGDFCTLAYGVKIFSQSDDYSGETLVNSLIPADYKNEYFARTILSRHVIVGTSTVIFPGVSIAEGTSIGAMSLVLKDTNPWGIYIGIPAKKIKERKRDLLKLEKIFLENISYDTI